jgi:hypothetical protein
VKVGGAETLLFRSCINCPLGQGKIEFVTLGQLPVPPEMSQQIKETKEDADEALKQAELEKNCVGEAGLLEGAIPVWGSGRDLIHAAQTGDKLGMAMNAAFLVWDVASVVAGVFSFGTATVAMAGAKAGGKVALGAAKKQMQALALKSAALKNGLKNIRSFAAKIPRICVTACFPAGTPVAVEGGYKNIEELVVGDLALKPVLLGMQHNQSLAMKPQLSLRSGADFRRFVLQLLEQKGYPNDIKEPALDDYLSSLWHLASQHKHEEQLSYGLLAQLLEKAFDYPPTPYDWKAELKKPYASKPYSTFPENTPEFQRELVSFERFERQILDQINIFKRIKTASPLPVGLEWENPSLDMFLERATVHLEEEEETEDALDWSDLSSLLIRGQWME